MTYAIYYQNVPHFQVNNEQQINFILHTFATSGDQIQPGDTEFTLILYFAKSKAMFFVRMLIAPLDAAYVHLKEYDENKNFDSCTKFRFRFCSTPTAE